MKAVGREARSRADATQTHGAQEQRPEKVVTKMEEREEKNVKDIWQLVPLSDEIIFFKTIFPLILLTIHKVSIS